MRKKYSSDLIDQAYNEIKHLIEEERRRPKGIYAPRDKLDAILYMLFNGATYRNLPGDFPPYRSVFQFKKNLEKKGIMDKMTEIAKKNTKLNLKKNSQQKNN